MYEVKLIYWAGFIICAAIFALNKKILMSKAEEEELNKELKEDTPGLEKQGMAFVYVGACIFWPILLIEKLYMAVKKCK